MKALIFGCGYLGHEVAQLWCDGPNEIFAVTRDASRARQFEENGLRPVIADITQPDSLNDLPKNIDVVLFAVGFDRSRYQDIREVYVDGLQNVLHKIEKRFGQLIYISSTGVYGNADGDWVDETSPTDPQRPGGRACLEAERLIQKGSSGSRSTILRLAGIYGPRRVPHLAAIEQKDWSRLSSHGHINLIHVRDAANIVDCVFERGITEDLYLVSDGQPPLRTELYDFVAEKVGTGPIDWSVPTESSSAKRSSANKRISNQKLVEQMDYEFMFPDFKAGIIDSLSLP